MFPRIDLGANQSKQENIPLSQVFDFKKKSQSNLGPYTIQIGAFGNTKNANRLKLQVSQLGHNVSIKKVESNGRELYAVRVSRYKSKKQAENVGRDIKAKLGINYKVLYRPINN